MVKNDPKTGKLTGRVPGKSIDIVRNPNWDKSTDYRPAYLDEIKIEEGNDDLATASRRALNGSDTVCCDAGSPPAQVLKQVVQHTKDQVLFVPSGGTRYIAFNTKVKPFDNINVRKAIIAASNRNALRLTRGGAILGDIATGWIPPGIPGFEEAGGLKQNTDLDYLANPAGDPRRWPRSTCWPPRSRTRACRSTPTASGPAGEKILTIATNADPGKKTAEVFQGQIEKLGLQAELPHRAAGHAVHEVLRRARRRRSRSARTSGWFKDFADPQSMLDADVQRQQHPRAGQRQLAPAQRPRDQRRP